MTDNDNAEGYRRMIDESNLRRLKAAMRADAKAGKVYVKTRDYTDYLGLSVERARVLMAEAKRRGWVEVWGKGRVYTYMLTIGESAQ